MNSANWFLPTVHSSVLHLPSSVKMAQQQIRQNYHEECEALVNKQINMQLYASHVYIALYSYFTRADPALPGFAHFCRKFSNAERNHGGALLEYQAKRGGKVVLQDIAKPNRMEWGTPLEAVTAVLELEKMVTRTLQELEAKAMEKKDFHLVAFIQRIQAMKVNIIKEIGDCQTKIKRAGDGAGLYIVDRELEKAVVTHQLMEMQAMASHLRNCRITDYRQERILEEQVENIREIGDWLANIRMA